MGAVPPRARLVLELDHARAEYQSSTVAFDLAKKEANALDDKVESFRLLSEASNRFLTSSNQYLKALDLYLAHVGENAG